MTDPDFGKNVVPPQEQKTEPIKPDSTYRHYFHILKKKVKKPVVEYDFERFGTLVEAEIPMIMNKSIATGLKKGAHW